MLWLTRCSTLDARKRPFAPHTSSAWPASSRNQQLVPLRHQSRRGGGAISTGRMIAGPSDSSRRQASPSGSSEGSPAPPEPPPNRARRTQLTKISPPTRLARRRAGAQGRCAAGASSGASSAARGFSAPAPEGGARTHSASPNRARSRRSAPNADPASRRVRPPGAARASRGCCLGVRARSRSVRIRSAPPARSRALEQSPLRHRRFRSQKR